MMKTALKHQSKTVTPDKSVTPDKLREDVRELAHDAAELAKQSVVTPAIESALEAKQAARKIAVKSRGFARTEYDHVVAAIQRKPMAALTIASLAGAVVGGTLLRRRGTRVS